MNLIAALKTIPALVTMINKFIDMWYAHRHASTDAHYLEMVERNNRIAKELKESKDDEARRDILRRSHS